MSKLLHVAALSLAAATAVSSLVGCGVGEPVPFDPRTLGEGERQQMESGGTIEFRNQSQLTYNSQLKGTTFGHEPSIENEFVLQITQPLLQNAGNEINRARIVINRNNQRISLLEFRKQLEE